MKTTERVFLILSAIFVADFFYMLFAGLGYDPCCGSINPLRVLPWAVVMAFPLWAFPLFSWNNRVSTELLLGRCVIILLLGLLLTFLALGVARDTRLLFSVFDFSWNSPQEIENRLIGWIMGFLAPAAFLTIVLEGTFVVRRLLTLCRGSH
jgi:hypothetical protein